MFRKIAQSCSDFIGRPSAFILATLSIIIWAFAGPLYNYSDTWQLVINTGTTVVTFLMIFLVQNTQNRDAKAIHLKLDELIRSKKGARNNLVDIEDETDQRLTDLHKEYQKLGQRTRDLELRHQEHLASAKMKK